MVVKSTGIKKKKKNVIAGTVHICATFNNTIISIADTSGNVVAWSSAGKMGFKGSRKATPYAAQVTMQDAMDKALTFGLKSAELVISGVGIGRDSATRALLGYDVLITVIKDETYLPHNGCRAKKKRRM